MNRNLEDLDTRNKNGTENNINSREKRVKINNQHL